MFVYEKLTIWPWFPCRHFVGWLNSHCQAGMEQNCNMAVQATSQGGVRFVITGDPQWSSHFYRDFPDHPGG